jgi:hypothetical protein
MEKTGLFQGVKLSGEMLTFFPFLLSLFLFFHQRQPLIVSIGHFRRSGLLSSAVPKVQVP